MISRLKTKCGSQFSCQLEGMFNDILIPSTIVDDFRHYAAQNSFQWSSIDLSVRVLTRGRWPLQSTPHQCNLPQMVHEAYQCFQSFYLKMHSGHRLTLQSTLGIADSVARFNGESKNSDTDGKRSSSITVKMNKERHHTLQVSTQQNNYFNAI
ncbi:unnamed protein product [Rotaria magnacalcarata]|uniref:Cullin family profile domain-containing protein n=2 Tax=Rotaria magnacalcarata TaxID=392030 RepID=A0A815DK61_9BILA|nr:unnamed protein product [Rotaria magnacalcarata]CAF1610028.1 unnamed protein product [Rotaria magnacalcarata]CAF2052519.1 unnamed protein product [Rotaria magnacalcarata]CAF3816058.1 unnamed protein product [Rotaria magnacalcarata]CAF4527641.1 unnamed protein product [Rotaria magnacalcarata]